MKIAFIFLILLFFTINIYCYPLEFIREYISFTIQDSYFCVNGIYYICNVTDKPVNNILYYPFPTDSVYGVVDSVLIYNLTDSIPAEIITRKENGLSFKVSLEPFKVGKYNIFYRQKLYGNKAEYILTTTKYWGKPLQKANFQLEISNHIKIDSLSYEPDSIYVDKDISRYFWERENFMPEEDFVVHYHKKPYKELTDSLIDAPEDKSHYLYLRLTPLLIPGVAVGYTYRLRTLFEDLVIDCTLAANYHYYPDFHNSYGLSLITEHFGNTQAKGIFFRANLGAEYITFQNFDGDQKYSKKWLPNVTVGLGYSIMISESSFLRMSAEIGYTIFIGRINCEFLF